MRRKRILSLLLSVIMVLSICASPLSSVFAAAGTESELSGSELTAAANLIISSERSSDPAALLLTNTVQSYRNGSGGNPFEEISGESAISIFQYFLSDHTEAPDSTEVTLEKLNTMSSKMDSYHADAMTILGQIDLEIESRKFADTITALNARNQQALSGIKALNEKQYLKTTLAEVSEEDKAQLEAAYENVMNVTTRMADYQTSFTTACTQVYDSSAFELALQKFSAAYPDLEAGAFNQLYRGYVTAAVKELILAYNCLITGYKAQENYCKLTKDESGAQTAHQQGSDLAASLRKVLSKYIKAYQNDSTAFGIQVGGGEEKKFHTFSAEWAVATEGLKKGESVEVTLYQDLTAADDKGFASQKYGDAAHQNGYTNEGGLYINAGGSLILNLNGHQINGGNQRLNLIEMAANTKLTVNGLSALKDGQVQGFYNAKTAVMNSSGMVEITLNNVQMKNFTEYGIYSTCEDADQKASKLTYNTGAIEGAQKGAVHLEMKQNCYISQCVFKDNKAEKGGAIYAGKNYSGMLNGCQFENNTAAQDGGAMYCDEAAGWTVENCTFTKNTAENRGGATYNIRNFRACAFTENIAKKQKGGAIYNPKQIDHCTFTGNESKEDGGGAVCVIFNENNEEVFFNDSIFTNNSAAKDGGAVYIASAHTKPRFNNCKFDNNLSKSQGGAIYAGSFDEINVKNSSFTGNTSWNTGGAISTRYWCVATIEDSVFTGNSSKDWDGGALFLTGLSVENHVLKNVTITGNTAKHWGGGVYCFRETGATGDFYAEGKVIIENNTAEKGSNVLLEQKNGTNKCVIKDKTEDGSRIGLNTDYDASRSVVYDVKDASRFFGDEGRKLSVDGSSLVTNELGGGGCNK